MRDKLHTLCFEFIIKFNNNSSSYVPSVSRTRSIDKNNLNLMHAKVRLQPSKLMVSLVFNFQFTVQFNLIRKNFQFIAIVMSSIYDVNRPKVQYFYDAKSLTKLYQYDSCILAQELLTL